MSLEAILPLLIEFRYLIMVPLIFVAQPVVGVAAGILARLDILDIPTAYVILLVTSLVGDAAWYWAGRTWGDRFTARFGRFVGVTAEHVRVVKKLFLRHHLPILVISKLVNGLGVAVAVLFTAGMSRVPFLRYMLLNLLGESVWSAFIILIGYSFGALFAEIEDDIGRASLVVLGILLFVVIYWLMRFMQRRYERYIDQSENGA